MVAVLGGAQGPVAHSADAGVGAEAGERGLVDMERGDVGLVWSQAEGGGDGGCGRRGVGQPREFQPCPGRRWRAEPHAEGLVFGVMVAGRLLEKCAGDAVKHVVAVVVVQRGGRPGLSGGLVLELLRCRGAEREAHADGRQQRHVPRLAAGRCQDRPGAGLREERVQQHRPAYRDQSAPRAGSGQAGGPPARRQAGTRLRLSVSPGLRLALSPGPGNGTGTGPGLGFRLGEQGLRRRPPRLAAWGRGLPDCGPGWPRRRTCPGSCTARYGVRCVPQPTSGRSCGHQQPCHRTASAPEEPCSSSRRVAEAVPRSSG